MTENGSERNRLRFLTYLTPEVPLDVFCLFREFIENVTQLETDLLVEDRFTGPSPNRADPFSANIADIIAIHSSDFLGLKGKGYDKMELCPAAPVHKHPMVQDKAVYFSEIIIHVSNKHKYKSMKDLKGCSWAFNNHESLSGNLIVLKYLKNSLGSNATYFGNVVQSGNHLNSIKMVKNYRVEAAAVDSCVLAGYLRQHDDSSEKIVSILSLGPLPIYPLLFDKRLSHEIKQKITEALLSMHKNRMWASYLNDVGITKFVPSDEGLYTLEEDVASGVQGMHINPIYY